MSRLEASTLFSAKGLVAVITGGGSGIGLMLAKALDANGAAAVYLLGRRADVLASAAQELTHGSARTIVTDVTSKDSLAAAAAQVERETGYVNVLFANAGVLGLDIYKKVPKDASLSELKAAMWAPEMEEFSRAAHVNVTAAFYTALAFLELLDAGNKKGNVTQKSQVVFTNSVASYSRLPAAGFDYSASKAGVVHLMKNLATVLAPYKIRANAIAPGIYPSDMTSNSPAFTTGRDPSVEGNVDASQIPLQRTGAEADMAGAALFTVSPAGAYLDGNVLLTDGGRLSVLPSSY